MNQTRKMEKEEKERRKKYGKMFSDFIVDCCMLYELDCRRRSSTEFDAMAAELFENWDIIDHHYKHLVDPKKLVPNVVGETMVFPPILRNISCHNAKRYIGNPMTNRTDSFISDYLMATNPTVEMD